MKMRKWGNEKMKKSLCLLPVVLCLAAVAAPHVKEEMVLTKGWNAVYLEATPDNPACDAFFADLPAVVGAAAYRSDADAATAQFNASGEEIVQKPVVYLQWIRGEDVSTLKSLAGGSSYLIYATNDVSYTYCGIPTAPRMTWRKVSSSETNEVLNLAGVSITGARSVSPDQYFGEGPFGTQAVGREIYAVTGTDVNGPKLEPLKKFGKPLPLNNGQAYALTATRAGDWPGVIGIVGKASVVFGENVNYASVKIKNCGTQEHVFTLRLAGDEAPDPEQFPPLKHQMPRIDALSAPAFSNVTAASSWTVTLKPDETTEQVFALDRAQLVADTAYGALLVIEEPTSQMRVRLPVSVTPEKADAVKYPTGLWVGEIALSRVSGLNDATPTPVTAGGQLKMNVMMHVDEQRKVTLLQRVAAGIDTNGVARLFKDLANVPPEVEGAKRVSTVMMSVDTPSVLSVDDFGGKARFNWTVAPTARDNPFRHAWHPDHDGKTADYKGSAPNGDEFENYSNPIKPELWSISNHVEFVWSDTARTPDETIGGTVTWEVTGLIANKPIRSEGTFALKRVFKAKKVED